MKNRSPHPARPRSTAQQTLAVVGALVATLVILYGLIHQAIGDRLIASTMALTIIAMITALGASGGTEKRCR